MNYKISNNIQKVIATEASKVKEPSEFIRVCDELVPLLVKRGDTDKQIITFLKNKIES